MNNPNQKRPKKKNPNSGQGKGGGNQGGQGGGGNRGGRGGKKRGKKNKANKPAIDPKRPVWENPDGDAELQAIVGSVRPAQNPTALVKSLGEPPLGKYASNAQHYYEAVYEKAQRFAIAMATARPVPAALIVFPLLSI